MPTQLSQRALRATSSEIREILKVTASPDILSFAGGIPAPETFPSELLRCAGDRILATESSQALQYSLSEGFGPLRTWIANRHDVDIENVLITTGSQQALDLLAKALIDPGARVLVESPTYLGALQAFSLFDPVFVELQTDESGIRLSNCKSGELGEAGLVYVMPNFQNPTGRMMPLEQRQEICSKMKSAGVMIIEDDPYGELSFSGQQLPSLRSINPEGVIYLGSFSKILAPGLRVGYVVAPGWLMQKLILLKQAADLHTSSLDQRLVHEVVTSGQLDSRIAMIRSLYSERCASMLDALERYMPEGVLWTQPKGGMFIWLTLPNRLNASKLLEQTLDTDNKLRVAFVPGASFFALSPQPHTLRLSFASMDSERIERGICALAAHVSAAMKQQVNC